MWKSFLFHFFGLLLIQQQSVGIFSTFFCCCYCFLFWFCVRACVYIANVFWSHACYIIQSRGRPTAPTKATNAYAYIRVLDKTVHFYIERCEDVGLKNQIKCKGICWWCFVANNNIKSEHHIATFTRPVDYIQKEIGGRQKTKGIFMLNFEWLALCQMLDCFLFALSHSLSLSPSVRFSFYFGWWVTTLKLFVFLCCVFIYCMYCVYAFCICRWCNKGNLLPYANSFKFL